MKIMQIKESHVNTYLSHLNMNKIRFLLLIALPFLISNFSLAQQSDEATIRQLENAEREAILKKNTKVLSQLMSSQIIVQNPENAILDFTKIIDRVKTGKINYTTFERSIEKIAFVSDIAIVMGLETLTPQEASQNAGKTVKRRFTNIWMKQKGVWKLTARQATIISIN